MNWLKKSLGVGHTPIALEFEFRGEKNKVTTTTLLAEGGYSFVYLARQSQPPHRQFAAKKVLTQDEETRGIAEMELQVLEQLAGEPGVVGYFGSCCKLLPNTTHREYWMLLEFCPNGSLIDLLYAKGKKPGEFERRPPLPEARVLEIFESIVTGVQAMHAQSPPVAHRDLKMENVLSTQAHEYVLCDFGSASTAVLPAERSRREVIEEEERVAKYSTASYRAPEMVDLYRKHEVGLKVDVWALGCILYALCFREHPFASESVLQILNASFTIPADSPFTAQMHTVIRAMLAPDPAERPAASRVLKVVQRLRALGAECTPAAAAARGAAARGAAAASAASPPTPPDFSAGFSADFGSASFADDGAFAALASPQPAVTRPVVRRVVRLELLHTVGGSLRARVTPLPLPGPPPPPPPPPPPREAAGASAAGAGAPPAFSTSTSFSAAFDADFGAPPPATPADREAEGVPRGQSDDFGDFEGAEGNDFGDFEGAAPEESGEPAAASRRGSVPFSAELD
jgi:serine/threonine protein kinase